jgi:hypothetical protein
MPLLMIQISKVNLRVLFGILDSLMLKIKNSGYWFQEGENILNDYLSGKIKSHNKALKLYIEAWEKNEETRSLTDIVSVVNNVSKFTSFLVGKRNIGIVARNITHHVLSQEVDLSSNWSIMIDKEGNMVNNASIFFDTNLVIQRKDSLTREEFPYKFSQLKRGANNSQNWYVGNKTVLKPGDKLYVSYAGVTDVNGNYISETLSAFLNAYVDVAADPYAF